MQDIKQFNVVMDDRGSVTIFGLDIGNRVFRWNYKTGVWDQYWDEHTTQPSGIMGVRYD